MCNMETQLFFSNCVCVHLEILYVVHLLTKCRVVLTHTFLLAHVLVFVQSLLQPLLTCSSYFCFLPVLTPSLSFVPPLLVPCPSDTPFLCILNMALNHSWQRKRGGKKTEEEKHKERQTYKIERESYSERMGHVETQ